MNSAPNPRAFLSFTAFDDRFVAGALTRLRDALTDTLRFLSGDTIALFVFDDVGIGQPVQPQVQAALAEALVFIPILTPNAINDPQFRDEVTRFLEREQQLGRSDLILPVYYQSIPALDSLIQQPATPEPPADPLIALFAQRRRLDWRHLQHVHMWTDASMRQELKQIAQRIIDLIQELGSARPTPPAFDPAAPVRQEYQDSLIGELQYLTIRGFAPQVGGRVISLPLADIFLPLQAVEGRPALAEYAEEDMHRQLAGEVDPRGAFDWQRRQVELEKRAAALSARQAAQRSLALAELLQHSRVVLLGDPGAGKVRRMTARVIVRNAPQVGAMTCEVNRLTGGGNTKGNTACR